MKRNRNVSLYENMYLNVWSDFIHSSPKSMQLSIILWINKLWYIHTTDYYSDLKRKELLIHEYQMNYTKWRKPDSSKGRLMWHSRRGEPSEHWSGFLGFQQEMLEEADRDRDRETEKERERDLNWYPINCSNFSTSDSSINKIMLKSKLYIPFRVLNASQGNMGSILVLQPGRLSYTSSKKLRRM